jgi:hypothetical protein
LNKEVKKMWTDILEHHGVKGQKWGVRRYQNKDGSLTSNNKRHNRSTNKKQDSLAKGESFVDAYLATFGSTLQSQIALLKQLPLVSQFSEQEIMQMTRDNRLRTHRLVLRIHHHMG